MEKFPVGAESRKYVLADNGPHSTIIRTTVELADDIDLTAMQAALEKTVATYPQLRCRLAWEDGVLYYVSNTEPVVLHTSEDEACALGSAVTGGYLWRVWAQGRILGFVESHAVADGSVVAQIISSLLYHYAEQTGIRVQDASGVLKEHDVPVPAFDPCVRYADLDSQDVQTPDIGPIFSIPEEFLDTPRDMRYQRFVLRLRATELKELARRCGSRMSPLIMALVARAMLAAWPDQAAGTSLLGPITTNLRSYFDAGTEGNFSSWLLAVLPPQLAAAELPVQCAAIQQAMESQLTESAMRAQLGSTLRADAARKGKTLDELFAGTEQTAQTVAYTRRFVSMYVSNVGAVKLPGEVEPLVRGMALCVPSFQCGVNLTLASVGDVTTMTLTQTFESDAFFQQLVVQMGEQGLAVEAACEGWHHAPQVGIDAIRA